MARMRFREWWPLFASIASFVAFILIPVLKFATAPTPFGATIHQESVLLPSVTTRSWPFPKVNRLGEPPKNRQDLVASFDPPHEVLLVTVTNAGPSVRHNVSMTVEGISTFAGLELGQLDSSNAMARKWLAAEYQRNNKKLILPPIPELAAESSFRVFVWGHFQVFGPLVELRSSEGIGSVDAQTCISGWPLVLALNAWWIVMGIFLCAGVWFLRRFRERKTSC